MKNANAIRHTLAATKAALGALALATAVGCSDTQLTDPHPRPAAPSLSATGTWTRVTFFNDHTFFVPCLGENVRFYGYVPFQYHRVENAAGGFDYHIQYRPETPNSPPFVAEGLTSGTVYVYQNGHPVNVSAHAAAGSVLTVVDGNEVYIASDGSELLLSSSVHMTVNANGDLVVDRVEPMAFACSAAP